MNLQDSQGKIKAWRDIWSAGQGLNRVRQVAPTVQIVERYYREYQAACTSAYPPFGVGSLDPGE